MKYKYNQKGKEKSFLFFRRTKKGNFWFVWNFYKKSTKKVIYYDCIFTLITNIILLQYVMFIYYYPLFCTLPNNLNFFKYFLIEILIDNKSND